RWINVSGLKSRACFQWRLAFDVVRQAEGVLLGEKQAVEHRLGGRRQAMLGRTTTRGSPRSPVSSRCSPPGADREGVQLLAAARPTTKAPNRKPLRRRRAPHHLTHNALIRPISARYPARLSLRASERILFRRLESL